MPGLAVPRTCPVAGCGYEALSDADLGEHQKFAHGTGGKPAIVQMPEKLDGANPRNPALAAAVAKAAAKAVEVAPAHPPVVVAPVVVAEKPKWHPALYVPTALPGFYIPPAVAGLLEAISQRTKAGGIVNAMLRGAKGTGKTTLASEFAAAMSRPFFGMDCGAVTEGADWWGEKELGDGRTWFERAALVDAVETPMCVILLDEINRTHPENLNQLFGLLDHRREAWVPGLRRRVKVAPGVTFFGTLNEGMEYVGTNTLDAAFRDRFSYTVVMGYPPKRLEKKLLVQRTGVAADVASRLVEFASQVRRDPQLQLPVSFRQLADACLLVKQDVPLTEAVQFTIVNSAPDDVDKKVLLQALQMVGKVDESIFGTVVNDDDDGK